MDGSNPVLCAADRKVFNPSVNASNNRLNTSEDYAYDPAGNTTGDPHGRVFKYDGENKQYEVRDSQSNIIGQYFFDGNAKRVKKVVPSTGEVTVFVYDSSGRLSAEYSTQLSQDPKVSYLTSDHLGSPRIKTDENGAVIVRNDYHPFGEDLYTPERTQALGYSADDVRQKFTGYEKDTETDLEFAQARMYSTNLGRFSTTDPSRKSISANNPQTWNRYAYCYNNPVVLVDDNGKWPTGTHKEIIRKAFHRIDSSAIRRGSEIVDGGLTDPRTMDPKNAPQHAMTPGFKVKELGSIEDAKAWAMKEAKGFIGSNLALAKGDFALSQALSGAKRDAVIDQALEKFGYAMHTIMDNVSPTHTGFQVFEYAYQDNILKLPQDVIDQLNHAAEEGGLWGTRQPTEAEMNLMIDEMRLAYQETFGQEAYEQAVSPEQRQLTAERLAQRGAEGMLIR